MWREWSGGGVTCLQITKHIKTGVFYFGTSCSFWQLAYVPPMLKVSSRLIPKKKKLLKRGNFNKSFFPFESVDIPCSFVWPTTFPNKVSLGTPEKRTWHRKQECVQALCLDAANVFPALQSRELQLHTRHGGGKKRTWSSQKISMIGLFRCLSAKWEVWPFSPLHPSPPHPLLPF